MTRLAQIFIFIATPLLGQKIVVSKNTLLSPENNNSPIVESQVVVHPENDRHLLATAMVCNNISGFNDYHPAVWRSIDGGVAWVKSDFEIAKSADPWVIINRDNLAVFVVLGEREGKAGLFYFISTDGAKTWSKNAGYLKISDHPTLTLSADGKQIWLTASLTETDSSNQFNPEAALNYSYICKLDENHKFSHPVKYLRKDFNTNALTTAILNDGTIVSSFIDLSPVNQPERALDKSPAWTIISTDNGRTFSRPYLITGQTGRGKGWSTLIADTNSDSKFKDRLYYLEAPGPIGKFNGVYLNYSDDKGKTWSQPKRVDQFNGDRCFIMTPSIAINKNGILGIAWYDRRNDPERKKNDVYFSMSTDGGDTFSGDNRITEIGSSPYTPGNGRVSETFSAGGHYSGLAAKSDGSFYLVWSDSRNGMYQLFSSSIRIE
jgi:hypothetical protein